MFLGLAATTGPSINYVCTYREGGSSLLYISIAYYMQKDGPRPIKSTGRHGAF